MANEVIAAPLTERRGLSVEKIQQVMAREQEKTLSMLYRIDQLILFMRDPQSDKVKQYHAQLKPSDPPVIQALWEANKNYLAAKAEGEGKLALDWFKQIQDSLSELQDLREKLLDRLHNWEKFATANGGGLGALPTEELEKLANGS